jgi:ribosomal protein S18 acetylase RimI-like enzyme
MELRQLRQRDFTEVRDLAMKDWLFAYSHLPAKEIEKLVRKYYSEKSLKKALAEVQAGRQKFVLAFENRALAGFCNVRLRGRVSGELLRLYVEPALIGKGFGKRLLVEAEAFLRAKGRKKYFAFVNKHNKLGVNFYLRNGFARDPRKDKADEFESKALWYLEKTL